jgi:DNA-binding transcriptional LysR family regulator
MLDEIETLGALVQYQTMSRVAVILRVSQSAISKRLAALENLLGYPVTERKGRQVEVTAAAQEFLRAAQPLVQSLRALSQGMNVQPSPRTLVLGISESLASEGLLKMLQAQSRASELQLSLHCHRSPLVYDFVAAGLYQAGICVSDPSIHNHGLMVEELFEESMVLVGGTRSRDKKAGKNSLPLWFIENTSHTGKQLGRQLEKLNLAVDHHLESFTVLAQCVKAGWCQAILPESTAFAAGFKERSIQRLKPDLKRKLCWISRKSSRHEDFRASLQKRLNP